MNVERARGAEGHGQLGRLRAVSEGNQDHGGVPVRLAVGLGRLDQGLDLAAWPVWTISASSTLTVHYRGAQRRLCPA
jgi:hypothetical protein